MRLMRASTTACSCSILSSLTFQTVEWGRHVASVHSLLPATHFLLPDLPKVINASLRNDFYKATATSTSPPNRIVTIQASRYNCPTSLGRFIQENEANTDKFLIVGGDTRNNNNNNNSSTTLFLSSVEAIQIAKHFATTSEVWATANPNDPKSIERVFQKIEAGATGIITQPLLSHPAMEILNAYPRQLRQQGTEKDAASATTTVVYIAGLALPKTHKSLLFWLNLLEQPELLNDSLFQTHLQYFMDQNHHHHHQRGNSLRWAQQELTRLVKGANVDGIHYMPMSNTDVLISLMTTTMTTTTTTKSQ